MKYLLLCNTCGNKVYTDGGKDLNTLIQVNVSPIPKRADGKDKTTVEQKKKFKCPKCGYLLHIVKLAVDEPKNNEPQQPL